MKNLIENTEFGRKEIMLVAHYLTRKFRQSFRQSLKESWLYFKMGAEVWFGWLRTVVVAKRKEVLSKIDYKEMFGSQKNGTVGQYSPIGEWFEKRYNEVIRKYDFR